MKNPWKRCGLFLLAVAALGAEPRIAPGPFAVNVKNQADGKPLGAVYVQLGGRQAVSDAAGTATLDGVPAGKYALVVAHPDFDRVEREVTLAAGVRTPLDLGLVPRVTTPVSGTVKAEGQGGAVAGARIRLVVKEAKAVVTGDYLLATDWEGKFSVIEVPVGLYRAYVSAPGFADKELDWPIRPTEPPKAFTLTRVSTPGALTVTVNEAGTQKPLANAVVTLAEAWPAGRIAEGRTDAGGRVVFGQLRLGQVNWANAKGELEVCGSRATVRVEADGHASAVVPVELGERTAATVTLSPTTVIPPREDNRAIALAQVIPTGVPVQFRIAKVGDRRFFRFKLAHPATVQLKIDKQPLQTHQRLLTADGRQLAERAVHENTENLLGAGGLAAGDYVVQVGEWYDDNARPEPLTLTVIETPAPDPFESNNTRAQARLVRTNQEVRGCLLPRGDVDWYRFESPRSGQVRITMPPHPNQRFVRLSDAAGKTLAETACHENAALSLVAPVVRGAHFFEVHEWYDDAESTAPYTARLEMISDDGIDDPLNLPGRAAAVRELALNRQVSSYIFPVGKFHSYAITLPSAGRLTYSGISPTQLYIRLLSLAGETLSEVRSHANSPLRAAWETNGPTTVVMEVHEWYDDACSPSPYVLRAGFEPCDEQELAGRNETAAAAVPVELNEPIRGNFMPVRDVDWYRVQVEFPGVLRAAGRTFTQIHLRILDAQLRQLALSRFHENTPNVTVETPVLPGEYYLEVREWYDDFAHPIPYELKLSVRRAEPQETVPLVQDPVRPLKLGEAQAFWIDQRGDRDRFSFEIPAAGAFALRLRNPAETFLRLFDDLTGAKVHEQAFHGNANVKLDFTAKGPTRYRLEIEEWYNDAVSPAAGHVLVDLTGREIVAENVTPVIEPTDPTRVKFTRAEVPGLSKGAKVSVDPDGTGRRTFEMGATGEFRYAAEGNYAAVAIIEGANGVRTRIPFWVEAIGPHERVGVHLIVSSPQPDDTIETNTPVRASAISYSGARISRIEATVDGRPVGSTHSVPYEIPVAWDTFGAGVHTLKVTAIDAKGATKSIERKFKVSEYFELFPRDGAQITGQTVAVSWLGRSFGPTAVSYRKAGEKTWSKTVQGPNGRARRMALGDLEPGVTYEFQPAGAGQGPVRTVTRVKGLAFGKTTYAAAIQRDYNQRVPVSVRNHGDKRLTVRLECGQPAAESMLLVGFVGEGSEGAPFDLAPGEEREFLLGISAQDCVSPKVTFPIRIASPSAGASDEALVELEIKLPNVALEWEEKGALPGGIGKIVVLKNKGDTLTDLSVGSSSTDLGIRPMLSHGLLPAGQSMEFQVVPRLYEGFRAAEGKLEARAVNKTSTVDQKVALKEGEAIHAVDLGPRSADPVENEIQAERALAGAYMNPAAVDWSKKTNPQDSNGDGKIDCWNVDIPWESTRWTGFDTDGDGEIDFVQADIGPDGRADYAAIKGTKGWEETNLVNSTLEMGFSLPWARSSYEKHDADIVFNGKVVGNLRDTIPDGNYSFPVPPSAFRFNEDGSPVSSEVRIQSKHLRGGHYVVSSNFKLKMNLTGTRVYTAAKSQQDAQKSVLATPGLVLDAPDLAVSSAELQVQGTAKSGSPLIVRAPVRNLGSGVARQVAVALVFNSGGQDIELARTAFAEIPPNDQVMAEITAPAPAGDVVLKLVIDPDKKIADCDATNNEARGSFKAEGDTVKPALTVKSPSDGVQQGNPVVAIVAEATDNEAIARVEVRVDQGLWTPLSKSAKGYEGKTLLQPGAHQLFLRAIDTSGNLVEKAVKVQNTAAAPRVEILEPALHAEINAASVAVVAKCDENTRQFSARVNGGVWQQGTVGGGKATVAVSLTFGDALIEVMAVDKLGMRTVVSRQVRCTRQRTEEEEKETAQKPPAGRKPAPVDVDGFGPVDPAAGGNPVVTDAIPSGAGVSAPVAAAGGEQEVPVPATNGAEMAAAPDVADEDGSYGSAPFEETPDPAMVAKIGAAEAAMKGADADNLDPAQWLNDPDTDTEENPEFAQPEEPADRDYEMPDMESWDEMPQPDATSPQAGASPQTSGAGFGPLPPMGEAGGYVGVQQNKADWYCTNRPEVGVKFEMPDWLKKLNVPKPGSKEFEAMFNKRLAALKARGMDTSQLEKIRTILQNRCKRLDSPTELPDFLQALGFQFGYKPAPNPSELAEWRAKMADAADSFMLRLLHSNDPVLIAQGLQARMNALGQFDAAAKESAEAALETVKATQKITEEFAMAVPYLNIAMSARALASGENLSGEKLGKLEMALNLLTVAGPAYQLFKNPTLRQAAASIGNKAMWIGENTIGRLAVKMGLTPDRVRSMMKTMSNALGEARIMAGEKLYGKAWATGERFLNTPAGREATARAARDVKQAESLLHRIAQARAAGNQAEYSNLIGRLQGNKTAQGLLNTPKYSNEFRNALDQTHRAMGRLADEGTIRQYMNTATAKKEIEALAKRLGVNPGDIVVRARDVSGNTKTLQNIKPGELLKYGADRDVVFQYCVKSRYGFWRSVKDVHHKAIERIYSSNLQRVTGRSAAKMDHVVTSRWNPEAYASGLNPNTLKGREAIADIISGKAAGGLKRPTDIRDTIIHKGKEWMESGHSLTQRGASQGSDYLIRLGNQRVKEGMRQMSKEYNRQVAQFLQAKGVDPARALPPRLKQGLDIFKQVEKGMPVEQAREMLKALTPKGGVPVTPESIAEDLGHFVEFMNRWGLRA